MPASNPPPESTEGDGARIDELMSVVESLRSEIRALREALALEVRTRRIVVAESDGFERLVASAADGFGHLSVFGRTVGGHTTCVELFANDPIDATGAHVGVSLTDHDEVVAVFEAIQGGTPRMWVAGAGDDDAGPAR